MLPWAEYWFNTAYNRSTDMTPFKALYGRDPPSIFQWKDDASLVEEVNEQLNERNELLAKLKSNLEQTQGRMKEQADRKRRELQFEEGDMVYLKIQPYKLKSLACKVNEKLSPRFYGPYKVLDRIGQVAYRLQLPETARIHPVFHVSQLKKSLAEGTHVQQLPEILSENMELQVEPEEVRKVRNMTDGTLQVLIKWKNLPEYDCTWEAYDALDIQFPQFHLEDKVKLVGGGNDGPVGPAALVYKRSRLRVSSHKAHEQNIRKEESGPGKSPLPGGSS